MKYTIVTIVLLTNLNIMKRETIIRIKKVMIIQRRKFKETLTMIKKKKE